MPAYAGAGRIESERQFGSDRGCEPLEASQHPVRDRRGRILAFVSLPPCRYYWRASLSQAVAGRRLADELAPVCSSAREVDRDEAREDGADDQAGDDDRTPVGKRAGRIAANVLHPLSYPLPVDIVRTFGRLSPRLLPGFRSRLLRIGDRCSLCSVSRRC